MNLLISDLDDTLFDTSGQLDETYSNIRNITPFDGVREILTLPNFKNLLVSAGEVNTQTIKLGVLGLEDLFAGIYICATNKEKRFLFEEILNTHGKGIPLGNIFVIGNRIDSEIRYGNELGLTTLFMEHGKYAAIKPKNDIEKPDYVVSNIQDAIKILRNSVLEKM